MQDSECFNENTLESLKKENKSQQESISKATKIIEILQSDINTLQKDLKLSQQKNSELLKLMSEITNKSNISHKRRSFHENPIQPYENTGKKIPIPRSLRLNYKESLNFNSNTSNINEIFDEERREYLQRLQLLEQIIRDERENNEKIKVFLKKAEITLKNQEDIIDNVYIHRNLSVLRDI